MDDMAIRVENLSKQYPSLRQPFDMLRTRLSTGRKILSRITEPPEGTLKDELSL